MSAFSILSPGVVDAIMCDVAVIASDAPSTQEFCKCKALWDTGAVFSVISRRLAAQLGLCGSCRMRLVPDDGQGHIEEVETAWGNADRQSD